MVFYLPHDCELLVVFYLNHSEYSGLVNGPEFYDFVQVIYILFENFEVHIINNIIKFNLTLYFYGYCKKRLLYTLYDNKRKY